MDFFERQDRARRNTKVLVAYFAIAVACIIVSVYIAVLLIFYGSQLQQSTGTPTAQLVLWNPKLFLYVALATIAVVAVGSLYKTASLSGGGSVVARSLGGRLLNPNTTHPEERKLQNVVEEMAIAAGVPVPEVYVLDNESGINAFAAGHTPDDAALGVTRGCMTALSRDELQGVIGHEFSHILNGDMRINLRLMGIIFGILCLAVIGRVLIYSRGGKDKNPLMLLGLALIIIGGIGMFFGRLIQAALSRQREFLADASAVQFTRNPDGLSGALQKIGGAGSRVQSAHAGEASHMFFGNGMGNPFLGALATHPPLEERIRAIDPGWDGKFERIRDTPDDPDRPPVAARRTPPRAPQPANSGMAGAHGIANLAAGAIYADAVLPNVGAMTRRHLRYAEEMRDSFPDASRDAAREPLGAAALVYAMLLSPDGDLRARQLAELTKRAGADAAETAATLWTQVHPLASRARLPLINLALPALRALRPDEFLRFGRTLQWLIESDARIDVFEFTLQKIVRRHLAIQSGESRQTPEKYRTTAPLSGECTVVLSALAHASSADEADVEKAYQAGAPHIGLKGNPPQPLPRREASLKQVDAALDRLAMAVPRVKKQLLQACVHVVAADGIIHERQAELLRAIAETLDCPMPVFLPPGEDD